MWTAGATSISTPAASSHLKRMSSLSPSALRFDSSSKLSPRRTDDVGTLVAASFDITEYSEQTRALAQFDDTAAAALVSIRSPAHEAQARFDEMTRLAGEKALAEKHIDDYKREAVAERTNAAAREAALAVQLDMAHVENAAAVTSLREGLTARADQAERRAQALELERQRAADTTRDLTARLALMQAELERERRSRAALQAQADALSSEGQRLSHALATERRDNRACEERLSIAASAAEDAAASAHAAARSADSFGHVAGSILRQELHQAEGSCDSLSLTLTANRERACRAVAFRLANRATSDAWGSWVGMWREACALRRRFPGILARWRNRRLALGWLGWAAWWEVRVAEKARFRRLVLRLKNWPVASAMMCWREMAASRQEALRKLRRVMSRLHSRGLAAGFAGWTALCAATKAADARGGKMIALLHRLNNRTLWLGWSTWCEWVAQCDAAKCRLRGFISRLFHRSLALGWGLWHAQWHEKAQLLAEMRRAVVQLVMGRARLRFVHWRSTCGTRQRLYAKAVHRIVFLELGQAMHCWQVRWRRAVAKRHEHVHRKLLGTLASWSHAQLRAGWLCWQREVRCGHHVDESKQQQCLVRAARKIAALERRCEASSVEVERLRNEHAEQGIAHEKRMAAMAERLAKAERIAERERRGRCSFEKELHGARASEHAASIATLQRALSEAEAHVSRVERSRYGYSPITAEGGAGGAPGRWPPPSRLPPPKPPLLGRSSSSRIKEPSPGAGGKPAWLVVAHAQGQPQQVVGAAAGGGRQGGPGALEGS